jgi:hypothetical protein
MKSDYDGLVEQSEMNQSVDENFNNLGECLFLDGPHVPYAPL